MTEKELFISWLNDVYSTELAMMPVLKNHAEDARDFPQIYKRDLQHLEETRRQAERVKTMIESLGGKISTAKSIVGKISGIGQSISSEFFSDELIKNFLSDYAAEHLEIASYKSLIATAKHLGENECVPILEEILAEEESMAAWLKEHIPMATEQSIKIVTGENGGKRSKKSNGKQSVAAKFFSPTTLATILGIGAAGAVMMFRSSAQKSSGDGIGENGAHLNLESRDVLDDSRINDTDDFGQIGIVTIETVVVTDDPEPPLTRGAGGDAF